MATLRITSNPITGLILVEVYQDGYRIDYAYASSSSRLYDVRRDFGRRYGIK